MSTLVVDPFFTEVPRAFGCSIADFVRGRSRSAWPAFERNEVSLRRSSFASSLALAGVLEGQDEVLHYSRLSIH